MCSSEKRICPSSWMASCGDSISRDLPGQRLNPSPWHRAPHPSLLDAPGGPGIMQRPWGHPGCSKHPMEGAEGASRPLGGASRPFYSPASHCSSRGGTSHRSVPGTRTLAASQRTAGQRPGTRRGQPHSPHLTPMDQGGRQSTPGARSHRLRFGAKRCREPRTHPPAPPRSPLLPRPACA